MKRNYLILLIFLLSACAPLPPTQQDIDAKRFLPVPGKAVIYIVRPVVDTFNTAPLSITGLGSVATRQGTYFRWEAEPGVVQIQAAGASTSSVTINAQAGQIYFVQHTATGGLRSGLGNAWVQRIDEPTGHRMVSQAQPI